MTDNNPEVLARELERRQVQRGIGERVIIPLGLRERIVNALRAQPSNAANIVLASAGFGEDGYQLHGLFASFDDALAHVRKDEADDQINWRNSADDRRVVVCGDVQWVASRQPFRTAWNTRPSPIRDAVADAEGVVDPQPEIVGSPLAKIISYNQAHEDAVEMGYPSLTEALEHLSELRTANTGRAEVLTAEAVARAMDPPLWSDDEETAHMAASPSQVCYARERAINRAELFLIELRALSSPPVTTAPDEGIAPAGEDAGEASDGLA